MSLAIRDGNNAAQTVSAFADASGNIITSSTVDNTRSTYSASILYTLSVATPTTIIVMQGSATKTIRSISIHLEGWSTTVGSMKFKIARRTSAGTLGAAVLTAIPSIARHDTTNAAPTAVVSTVGTANYTTQGTLQGILNCGLVSFAVAAGVSGSAPFETDPMGQAFVLRGAGQWLTVNSGNDGAAGDAVPAGAVLLATLTWVEDDS